MHAGKEREQGEAPHGLAETLDLLLAHNTAGATGHLPLSGAAAIVSTFGTFAFISEC